MTATFERRLEEHLQRFTRIAFEYFLQVEAGVIRRDRDGAPRHLDDRSPLAVEPPNTTCGGAMSRCPKIVGSRPQDLDRPKKKGPAKPGPSHLASSVTS